MKKIILWLAEAFGVDVTRPVYVEKEVVKYISADDVIEGDVTVYGDLVVKGELKVEGNITSFKKS